ncbi:glutamine amidotransferase [Candidatus Uabimicrobium sp. HlEnr_7]|uniref:glutamine amidotransferase n=1 Tax=Candidatus Uabimicrobium helgolandensis TaxID=3095367 RepID=UPI0035575EF0
MSLYVSNYWAFLLLLFIPFIHYVSQKSLAGLSKFRRRVSVFLRYVLLMLLILALADINISISSKRLSVLFILDLSKSIPEETEKKARRFIENAIGEMDAANNEYGLLVFGKDASFEYLSEKKKHKLKNIQSQITKDQTDIAGAIRLSIAALPNTGQRRIVLISDGNETIGDAMQEIEQAISDEITIDVVPLTFQNDKEVLIDKMLVPSHVNEGQSYEVTVVASSRTNTTGILRLFLNGELVRDFDVDLKKGKSSFDLLIPGEWVKFGFHKLKAIINSKDDSIIANNIVEEFTYVRGVPKILYVEGDMLNSDYLYDAIQNMKNGKAVMHVDRISPEQLPSDILTLNTYDSIILSNVAAYELSLEQMQLIESAVHEAGVGLIMIGGEKSFGAGGYKNTPIERALPVDMDIRNRRIIPNGALAVILHTCEFPKGNATGREICKQAIKKLSPEDYAGVIIYDYTKGAGWLIPPTKVVNKSRIMSAIDNSNAGDMPSFDPALRAAYQGLSNVPAMKKHIIIITDGDPSTPNKTLMKKVVKSKISITTIVINPHSPGDGKFMQQIAQYTGGNFYDVTNAKQLPNIFIKESMVVRSTLIFEEKRAPKMNESTTLVRGIQPGEIPPIYGCILTIPKKRLVHTPLYIKGPQGDNEPLLVHGQYGLGRSVAFTSDAKNRWGKDWISWEKYDKFWRQVVRWSARQVNKNNFKIYTQIKKGKGQIAIDAINSKGEYMPYLRMQGTLIKPDGRTQLIEFSKKGVGRYQGEFEVDGVGTYLASVVYQDKDGNSQYLTTGLSVSFSSEYLFSSSNTRLLGQIASSTGGRNLEYSFMDLNFNNVIEFDEWKKDANVFERLDIDENGELEFSELPEQEIFLHDKPRGGQPKELWRILVTVFVILFFIDIFVRRVLLDYQKIWQSIKTFSLKRELSGEEDSTMSRLMLRKEKARQKMDVNSNLDLKKLENLGRKSEIKNPTVGFSKTETTQTKTTTKQTTQEKTKTQQAPDYTSRLLAAKKKTWEKDKEDS